MSVHALTAHRSIVMCTSLQQVICRAPGLIVEDSFCRVHRVEAAADPDGTFAMARVEPCFRVPLKMATVVAVRLPPGQFLCWQRRVQGGVGRPGLSVPACLRPAAAA